MSTDDASPDLRVRLDHVGIAVEDRSTVAPVLSLLGARLLADEPADGYRWVLYEIGDLSRVELLEPTADGTFLTEFLDGRGPGLHHVTFEVGSIDAVTARLESAGIAVVDRADRPGYREGFVSPTDAGGVLIQLMEFEPGYTDRYGEPGVGDDLLPDRSFLDRFDDR